MVKYYLDTCIWRDFFENRLSKTLNPIGKYAADLFVKIIANKDKILYSDALILELRKDYDKEEIMNMLNVLSITGILIKVKIKEHKEAKALSKERDVPYIDALIAIQAKKYDCILVSRDMHLINNLKDIIKAKRPEDIT